ncbi:MAG: tRNA (adenosine(37)-N6)-threonylcarbamoyltransferase complex ATPase subunit type 1 TsaE [Bacteroidetes bacterium]|nr:tRNA (adenosine(37)-N6)-threonylcarbamoyltransferase complex ATPase subunit type 1 TsaE [Bacteroidota bacterium]MBU1484724.1 tRNA (adenosine(37)-N6)-threonylcarbamoyltransferase complex ATPase subunit type 1 TsaE [Bacteroidota bacterium]MBU2267293.1 tRNA (adenosine(37)-N6)-threonylcarbamoyltransferase complex ATPase subunit type 1 TsaE [Bacteroidota bacterium]MBU2376851.1 tRNA (adenosine(37)-N6)-threonylcarbamoyltransferase complex ATPase subunit type 1 TsaE [Bacteroidota bacterium]
MQIKVENSSALPDVAQQILSFAGEEKIFLFYGEMGAGKTTLINQISLALGTKDHTSSPTFSIVNEYKTDHESIFHFDFYRLKNQREALDLGYEDYFYSGNYCFVEWPEKIPDLLPESFVKIEIVVHSENERLINITK